MPQRDEKFSISLNSYFYAICKSIEVLIKFYWLNEFAPYPTKQNNNLKVVKKINCSVFSSQKLLVHFFSKIRENWKAIECLRFAFKLSIINLNSLTGAKAYIIDKMKI